MNTTTYEFLFKVEPPWIHLGPGEPERAAWVSDRFYSRPGLSVCVRRLRGHKMRTTEALMNEFAAALQFFDGFGENWYALEECLGCLDEWLPADAYVLLVERAEELLRDESLDELITFLNILNATAEAWARPVTDNDRFNRRAIPFHMLLAVSKAAEVTESRIAKAARKAGVELRL